MGMGPAGVWNDCGDAPPAAYIDWWLPRRRAELETMTNEALGALLSESGWRDRIREEIIADRVLLPLKAQHRQQSADGAERSAAKRSKQAAERDFKITERVRQLPAERRKTAKLAYSAAQVKEEMPFSSFERRLWPKIRQKPG